MREIPDDLANLMNQFNNLIEKQIAVGLTPEEEAEAERLDQEILDYGDATFGPMLRAVIASMDEAVEKVKEGEISHEEGIERTFDGVSETMMEALDIDEEGLDTLEENVLYHVNEMLREAGYEDA